MDVLAWEPKLDDVTLAGMPEAFRDIADAIGLDATRSLIDWRGGTRLSVPHVMKANHAIARQIGTKAALALAEKCGGLQFHVPRVSTVIRSARNRTIRSEFDAGARIPDLCSRFGLCENAVRRVLYEEA